ncbi:hypothetical protein ABW19_dt0204233 [Dactylella cylindrospora]|nr:hypothetical protein ABW19_dt0204233 [Dactylella cylindrospora]
MITLIFRHVAIRMSLLWMVPKRTIYWFSDYLREIVTINHKPPAIPPSRIRKPAMPYLPPEIQLEILEHADYTEHSRLARVCKRWRDYILNSPVIRDERYVQNAQQSQRGRLMGKGRRPRLHKITLYYEAFYRLDQSKPWTPIYYYGNTVVDGEVTTYSLITKERGMGMGCFRDEPLVVWEEIEGVEEEIDIRGALVSYSARGASGPREKLPELEWSNYTVGQFIDLITRMANEHDEKCPCITGELGQPCNIMDITSYRYLKNEDIAQLGIHFRYYGKLLDIRGSH